MTKSAAKLIDERIAELGDWRGKMLSKVRKTILSTSADVVEEWKWRGTPTWSLDGILCTGETYRDKVKLTFAKGASLKDPSKLFNASLDGKVRRAIDLFEGDQLDAAAFKALVKAAIAQNLAKNSKSAS